MNGKFPDRFATRFTPVDREFADRQWAEWAVTRRRLLKMGAFGGAGFSAGDGIWRPSSLLTAAAPRWQDGEPVPGGTITMSMADSDATSFDPPVPPDNMRASRFS